MSNSGAQRSPVHLLTVGDFDPQADKGIEYDFIGRVIAGRYTVQEHIGGGGMADVYRATDQQLGIDVAIKLLKPRMASDELRARMVQEAQAAAQVRHSHVVRVFGTGALDRTAFIVMEWLDGPNLEQYLREYRGGRMPVREAIELLVPAIEALHEIHEQGYVHRDIKTGNILITRIPGQPPAAVVIDLGLVKPDRALRNAASPPTTEVGRLLCTPGYTSPEQAAGKPVDRRSDVYSMAVTLYRVLAGRLPFHDARGQPLALLAKHIYNAPTMLAEAAGTADIPVGVAAVVEGAMSKDPAKRPQTMQALADALRAAMEQPAVAPQLIRLRQTRTLLLGFGLGMLSTWVLTPSTTCPPAPAVDSVAVPNVAPSASQEVGEVEPRLESVPPPVNAEAMTPVETVEQPLELGTDLAEPQLTPPANATPLPTPTKRGNTPNRRALDRALDGRAAEVRACAKAGAGGVDRIIVGVNIDTSGRISARVAGFPDTPLNRCVDAALRHTPVAVPQRPISVTHTFSLRAAAPSP
jgi:serine/threonine protein kinase